VHQHNNTGYPWLTALHSIGLDYHAMQLGISRKSVSAWDRGQMCMPRNDMDDENIGGCYGLGASVLEAPSPFLHAGVAGFLGRASLVPFRLTFHIVEDFLERDCLDAEDRVHPSLTYAGHR
jgi:hypothetical protein